MSAISAMSNSPTFPPPLLSRVAALEVLVTGQKVGAVGRLIPRLETLEMAAFERVQSGDLTKRVLELEQMLMGGPAAHELVPVLPDGNGGLRGIHGLN